MPKKRCIYLNNYEQKKSTLKRGDKFFINDEKKKICDKKMRKKKKLKKKNIVKYSRHCCSLSVKESSPWGWKKEEKRLHMGILRMNLKTGH